MSALKNDFANPTLSSNQPGISFRYSPGRHCKRLIPFEEMAQKQPNNESDLRGVQKMNRVVQQFFESSRGGTGDALSNNEYLTLKSLCFATNDPDMELRRTAWASLHDFIARRTSVKSDLTLANQ